MKRRLLVLKRCVSAVVDVKFARWKLQLLLELGNELRSGRSEMDTEFEWTGNGP